MAYQHVFAMYEALSWAQLAPRQTVIWQVTSGCAPCFQPIDIYDVKYQVVSEGFKRRLEIVGVTNKDEGLYSCRVQDKATTAKLYVARKYQSIFTVKQLPF